ncbi:MAG: glycosyltransferase family 39 protein [Candidatus Omnitrophica bacterium]|nr:glycosyltransferase family 39 protein [Candidatus Omnitrophota bacterium]
MLKKYKYLIILLALFTLYNAFFINKAIHIDDHFTVSIAKAVNEDFINVPRVFFSNPILLGYYYAPIIRLFGEREAWLHIFYLPFTWLAIIAMFFLSLRFTGRGILPTLFLISTPAFIIMSQDIMLDIALLGFFLASIALFVHGADKDDNRLLFLSVILISCAIFIKYSGLMLIPILAVYSLLYRRRKGLIFLLIPISFFILWNVHNLMIYGESIFLSAVSMKLKEYFFNNISIRVFAFLSFLSGTSIISLFLIPSLLNSKRDLIVLTASLPIGFCPFLARKAFLGYSLFEKTMLTFLFIVSLYIILKIVATFLKPHNKDNIFLSIWFFILLFFTIFSQFIAARFALLLFPPMFLIIYNQMLRKRIIAFFLILAFSLSTILAIGDYHFAGVYRNVFSGLKKSMSETDQLHYLAGDWGYRYYARKAGCRIAVEPKAGDIFIMPKDQPIPYLNIRKRYLEKIYESGHKKTLINRLEYFSNAVLHDRDMHAGFYCNDWGLLPFSLSMQKVLVESFKIYKLSYLRDEY